MLALLWSRLGCPPLCDARPKEEEWVSPRASKLACCPALTNTGWPGSRGAPSAAVEGDGEEEEAAPFEGGGSRPLARGRRSPHAACGQCPSDA